MCQCSPPSHPNLFSYDKSIALQKAGDPRGSTEAYLAALEAQAKLRSMPIPVGPEVQALPSELYALIFRMLSTQDLLRAARVSRGWRRLTRDARCAHSLSLLGVYSPLRPSLICTSSQDLAGALPEPVARLLPL